MVKRLRGASGFDIIGTGGEEPADMDRSSAFHMRWFRLPRGCNPGVCVLAGTAILAMLFLFELRSLKGTMHATQHDLAAQMSQLRKTLAQNPPPNGAAHPGDQVSNNVYLKNHRSIPTMWLMSKSVHHLNHVITVFERAGYQLIRQGGQPFDVIWSYDYPFSSGWKKYILDMRYPQKINHFPGSGYITNKMSLSTSKIKYLPRAYRIPGDVKELKTYASEHPKTMWVMKSNDHRGIKIKTMTDMDLSTEGRLHFVQEFVGNPLLIDGRKFDIGVYVAIASVNPLRVYVYNEEVLLRFCTEDYHPLDTANVEKYVIGDKYTPTKKIPSLTKYTVDHKYSMKQTLNVYLQSKGFNSDDVWTQIHDSIRQVTLAKENDLKSAMASYPDHQIFFEMVRFDFVLDDKLQLWLMEVNMSPNLSSSIHPENAIMYEQVVFNTLALVGAAHYTAGSASKLTQQERDMMVRDSDVLVPVDECRQDGCKHCEEAKCVLCQHCMSENQKKIFKQAFVEHTHRRNFVRVFPVPHHDAARSADTKSEDKALSTPNKVMDLWYGAKCRLSKPWCI